MHNQNGTLSTPPFLLSSAYYYYFHIAYWQTLLMQRLQNTGCCVYCLMLGLNTHDCAGDRYLSKVPLMWLWKCVTIGIYWFPLIIPSPINLLIQSCSHFHKGCRRNILVWLQVTPHQTTKWDNPLVLFGFKPQQQPSAGPTHYKKQENIIPSPYR